jgi:hypothetical protein
VTGETVSSGTQVGLANIRERLVQAYGDDHRLELAENTPQGLIVLIDIPYQVANVGVANTDGRELKPGAVITGPQSMAAQ